MSDKKGNKSLNSSQNEQSGSVRTKPDVVLPQAKVKVIMKSSPEVEQIGNDALFLITKSTVSYLCCEDNVN